LETRVYVGTTLKEWHVPLIDGTGRIYYSDDNQLMRSSDFYINSLKPRGEASWEKNGESLVSGSVHREDGTLFLEQARQEDGSYKMTCHLANGITAEIKQTPGSKELTCVWKKGEQLWFQETVSAGMDHEGRDGLAATTTFFRLSADGLTSLRECTIGRPVADEPPQSGGKNLSVEVVYYGDDGRALFVQTWKSEYNPASAMGGGGSGQGEYRLQGVRDLTADAAFPTGAAAFHPDRNHALRLDERDAIVQTLRETFEKTLTKDTSVPALRWYEIALP
jgi:hypothetical protein